MPFVKLDCKMLRSSIWRQRDHRSLFVTALLMGEPFELKEPTPQLEVRSLNPTGWTVPPGWYGLVEAAGSGIVEQDGMAREAGLDALEVLGAPDPESRSPEYDGRRLVRVAGGYLVLNFFRYRDKDHAAADRMRRMRERRKKEEAPALPLDDMAPFDQAWARYPKRGGGNSRKLAEAAFRARLRDGVRADALIAGVERYAAYIRAKGDEGTEFVKQAATFFGARGQHWAEAWTPPASRNGHSREARNDREIDKAFEHG